MTLDPIAWGERPIKYVVGTHKAGDPGCQAPADARFAFQFRAESPAKLSVHALVDHWGPRFREYVAEVQIAESDDWQHIVVSPGQCVTQSGDRLESFAVVDRIDFVGESPPGRPPAFAHVRWLAKSQGLSDSKGKSP
jgi:hypothetical protein